MRSLGPPQEPIAPLSSSTTQQQAALLPSERYIPRIMPAVFGTADMTGLFLLNVFWVTNITPLAAGGPVSFLYWLLCGILFFVPCSLVMAQLAYLYPSVGASITGRFMSLVHGGASSLDCAPGYQAFFRW
ncbi:hypothetical protein [Ktedonospora formicarum]|uniref:hypothetical protein n=1 Tax=Ktedonospora formicarum TaxID=2778364 RepID=UPI001F2C5CF8|nr:hypothetical protein [Ktedonospora formicarum]